jgi:hypothetical protein
VTRALVIAIALAGCTTTGGGDDQICAETTDLAIALRDPSTGQCQGFDGGCRGIPYPDWAPCNGACDALDEATCEATAHCRAIYTGTAPNLTYYGCWGTAPSSSLGGVSCANLDPYQCSEDDQCAAVFAATPATPPLSWQSCIPEPAALEPGTCNAGVTCRALPPACPSGTQPGEDGICYTGYCIPTTACGGPIVPGGCAGAVCQVVGPACPSGTVAGTSGGCWTGYCIPISACPA